MKSRSEWLTCDAYSSFGRVIRLGVLAVAMLWPQSVVCGREPDNAIVSTTYHADILEMSLVQNLLDPEIPRRQIPAIEAYQKDVALRLKKLGYDVELMRDRQVVVVTIPAAKLFSSGSHALSKNVGTVLGKLVDLMLTPDKYKILVVAHSDDTGSEEYLNNLTAARANALTDWLVASQVSADNIVPYGLGSDEPRSDNSSRAGREANRRIELYLVPGPTMIIQAKSGKL